MWIADDVGAAARRGSTRDRVTGGPAATEVVPSSSTTSSGRPSATAPATRSARRAAARPSSANGGASARGPRDAGRVRRRRRGPPPRRACSSSSRALPHRRRRSPSRTRATWPSSMSCPRQSASAPASEREHGALLHPHRRAHRLHLERVGDDHAGEAELVAQQPGEQARLSVAGTSSSAGTTRWAVMIARVPAAIAARNGASSTSEQLLARRPRRRAARGASRPSVAPWPGKCFAQAATPPACRPSTNAATWRATSAGSEPNERTPITGLSGFVLTSATGARSCVMPAARSSSARARRDAAR